MIALAPVSFAMQIGDAFDWRVPGHNFKSKMGTCMPSAHKHIEEIDKFILGGELECSSPAS